MKLKKILAGLVAGAMAASMAVQTAGAEEIVTVKLYDEYYNGTITISGKLTTSLPILAGDEFRLAQNTLLATTYANLTSAETDLAAAGTSPYNFAWASGTKKQSSVKGQYIFDRVGKNASGVSNYPFSTEIDQWGNNVIAGKKVGDTELAEIELVGAKVGNASAVIGTGGVRSTTSSGGSGNIMWLVDDVDNIGLGGIASNNTTGQKTLNFSFTFQLPKAKVGNGGIAEQLKSLTSEALSEVAGANTFTIAWITPNIDSTHNRFKGTVALTWSGGDALTQAAIDALKGTSAYASGTKTLADALTTSSNVTALLNAWDQCAGTVGKTTSDLDTLSPKGTTTTANVNPVGIYNITGEKIDLSGIYTEKTYNDLGIDMVAQISDADLLKIGAAAKAGQNITISYNLKEAIRTDYNQFVCGYAPFVGTNNSTQVVKTNLKKGSTSIELVIPAADVFNDVLGYKLQYVYYIGDLNDDSPSDSTSRSWEVEGNQSDSKIQGGMTVGYTEKNPHAIIVESITIHTGGVVTSIGYPATWAGATQAVKDALGGKTTWPTATSAVKAVLK